MMTPQEVANCTFTKAVMGGYNMAAVDDFLDKLTEDYTALYKDNAALKSKMKVLVDKLAEYQGMEDAMRSTLLTAQKMATSLVSEAEAKRDALIADAAGAAKVRLEEIQQEVAAEEARLAQVRADVAEQIEAEQKRLAIGQSELRTYIQTVQSVCQQQLALLEKLPELPAAPVPAPVVEEPVQAEPSQEEPAKLDEALEKDIENVFASFAQEQTEEPAPAQEEETDPFAELTFDDGEDIGETRVLNLDDLQFGRNYTKD